MSVYFKSESSYLSIQQNLSNAASLQFSIALGIITLFRGSKLNLTHCIRIKLLTKLEILVEVVK